jgi:hypothetical protein
MHFQPPVHDGWSEHRWPHRIFPQCYRHCRPLVSSTFPGFLSVFLSRLTLYRLPGVVGANRHRPLPLELINTARNVTTEATIVAPLWTPSSSELPPPRPCSVPSPRLPLPCGEDITLFRPLKHWRRPRQVTLCHATPLVAWAGWPFSH